MFAVLSHILPPSPSGQAMVLYRILRDLNSSSYCLISRENYTIQTDSLGMNLRLPAKYYHINAKSLIPVTGIPGIRTALNVVNVLLEIAQRARGTYQILQKEKCSALVACTGDLYDPPVGYLACRWAKIPFYVYAFDDYVRQWTHPAYRLFAECVESIIMRNAKGVIAPNEFLCDEYRRRYRIEPVVIHNPCGPIDPDSLLSWPAKPGEIKIVYTGAIYHAHYDAFSNLLAAMRLLDDPRIKLHIYTSQAVSDLEQKGIVGPVEFHPHISLSEIADVQRCADILFLPLAFNSTIPDIIRTSAPGKMGEYLASGRPVLAHAPEDSFVNWYFRTYNVGQVANCADPNVLAQALKEMINEPDLRRQWCKNALHYAQKDFSLPTVRAKFLKLFSLARDY
jgi:glycosyltransferase involved in cell wall biosynthesis